MFLIVCHRRWCRENPIHTNAGANDEAKCEWAFRKLNGDNFERQHPQPRLTEIDIYKLSAERCICSVEISQVVLGKVQVKASVACLPPFYQ